MVLIVVFVCACDSMFGSAIPLLYLVAGVGLAFRSAVDRLVLLRHYQRPQLYEEQIFYLL